MTSQYALKKATRVPRAKAWSEKQLELDDKSSPFETPFLLRLTAKDYDSNPAYRGLQKTGKRINDEKLGNSLSLSFHPKEVALVKLWGPIIGASTHFRVRLIMKIGVEFFRLYPDKLQTVLDGLPPLYGKSVPVASRIDQTLLRWIDAHNHYKVAGDKGSYLKDRQATKRVTRTQLVRALIVGGCAYLYWHAPRLSADMRSLLPPRRPLSIHHVTAPPAEALEPYPDGRSREWFAPSWWQMQDRPDGKSVEQARKEYDAQRDAEMKARMDAGAKKLYAELDAMAAEVDGLASSGGVQSAVQE